MKNTMISPIRFGNPLDRKSRDTGSNKQVDGNRRCDHTDRDADNEQDSKMYGADSHGLDKRQEHRGKNNDRGGGLHEDSGEQDDQGDQEHDHILVCGDSQYSGCDRLRDLVVCENPAERTAACDDDHDDCGCFCTSLHDLNETFEVEVAVDKEGNEDRVDNRYSGIRIPQIASLKVRSTFPTEKGFPFG